MEISLWQAKEMLSHYSYKPGYEFRIDDLSKWASPAFRLSLIARLEDSCNPGRFIKIVQSNELFVRDKCYLDHLVKKCAVDMELHEVDEWLKLDGKLVNNPHG